MSSLIVKLPQGELEGKESKSILSGETYYSFLGIPYAQPPVGNLRFKPPEPCEKWIGVYDATFERHICLQKDFFPPQDYIGSENCLFLSVDTPQIPAEVKVPKAVMVWIHGGGFAFGDASQELYGSDYLVTRDVIVVRVYYRLHVFGFLNLGLPDCPGNMGLKDQTLAIKWVKDNIAHFGGDPNNITIFGESAGGSSVHFQTISPLAKGLFNKAIIQSGSSLSPWAMSYDYKNAAEELGDRLGFTGEGTPQLLQFLKLQSGEDLTRHASEMADDIKRKHPGRLHVTPFIPTVEEIKEGAFLPDSPENLFKTADPVPIIYGLNDKEGIILYALNFIDQWDLLRNDFGVVLRSNFEIDPDILPEVSAKVLQYYFGSVENIGPDAADPLINLFSDICFYKFYEAIEFAMSSSTPPYVYEFSYGGGLNMCKPLMQPLLNHEVEGAFHGDELGYIFNTAKTIPNPVLKGEDLTVLKNMITLWTNFARTGKPTKESVWSPTTSSHPRYLKIDRTVQLINGKVYGERLQFLKNLLGPVAKPLYTF